MLSFIDFYPLPSLNLILTPSGELFISVTVFSHVFFIFHFYDFYFFVDIFYFSFVSSDFVIVC